MQTYTLAIRYRAGWREKMVRSQYEDREIKVQVIRRSAYTPSILINHNQAIHS